MTIASNLSFVQNNAGAITTGTFNSGAGPVTFSIGGTEYNRVDGNGYSLLGYTTSQGAHKLQVNGNIYASGNIIGNITGNVTGVVSTASNLAGGAAGQLHYQVSPGISGFINTSSVTVGTATNATNLLGGAAGGILYQTGAGASTFLALSGTLNSVLAAGASAPQYVTQVQANPSGTGSASAATGQTLVVTAGGIGITGDSYLAGSVGVGTNLTVTGNLTVNGTTITANSTITNVSDPIITIGGGTGGAAPISDDSKDRGIAFQWFDSSPAIAKVGFFGFDRSTRYFTFLTSATITTEITAPNGGTTKGALDAYLAGGAAQSLVYQSAADTTAYLAAGTAGFVLQTNGTGSAPSWVPIGALSAGTATSVTTVQQTVSANYYPTFVSANNVTGAAMSFFTTASFYINPANGAVQHNGNVSLGQPNQLGFANGQYIKDNGAGGFVQSSAAAFQLIAASGVTMGTAAYAQQSGAVLSVNGNAYINGITTITNSIVQSGGYAYLGNYNTGAAIYPASFAAGGQGLAFGLNFSNGNVEQNIWNTTQPSTYSGTGIRFMQYLTASTNRDLLFLSNTGAVAFGAPTNYGTAGQVLQSNGNSTATWVSVSGLTAGSASQLATVQQTASASYYPTFVDSNNVASAQELHYTTSSFSINPASGYVGHGIATPTAVLHANQTAGAAPTIQATGMTSSNTQYDVLVSRTSGGTAVQNGPNIAFTDGTTNNNRLIQNGAGNLMFYSYATGAWTETMRISSSNQVGIGSAYAGTSGALLAVNGNTYVNGTFTATSNGYVVGNLAVGTAAPITNKFEVRGTAGQLFSVSDSFTGTVFSASDISGIPSIEVLDTGLVKLAQYNGLVTVSTGTAVAGSGLSVWTSTYILSLGVGTSGSGTIGEIRATNEVTAYYSDRRLKENVQVIDNAVVKVLSLTGITYTPNAIAESYGYDRTKKLVGVFADEIEAVLPEAVRRAPFDVDENGDSKSGENYKTVQYEKIVPLLIEAIKEQQKSIENLQTELAQLKSQI